MYPNIHTSVSYMTTSPLVYRLQKLSHSNYNQLKSQKSRFNWFDEFVKARWKVRQVY